MGNGWAGIGEIETAKCGSGKSLQQRKYCFRMGSESDRRDVRYRDSMDLSARQMEAWYIQMR